MTTTVAAPAATTEVAIIPLADIRRSGNVRQDLGDLESLAQSIREHGVLTAVLVERQPDGAIELVAGFRRVAAAAMAGLELVPAIVRDPVTAVQSVSDQVAENDDRCGLSALEVAGAMQQMLDLGASAVEVAQRFDITADSIERWRAVLALPAPLLALVREGIVDAGEVADLGELAGDDSFVEAVVREVRGGSSPHCAVRRVRQERELAARVAESQAQLEAGGCPEVAAPRYDTVTTNSKTQRLGEGVEVSLRRHRKLPCHAAFINARGEAVYVCTDRSRHAGEAGSGVLDLTAQRAAKRAAAKELRDAAPVRADALKTALSDGAVAHDDAVRHILTTALWDAHLEELEDACGLLDLALPEEGWGMSRPLGVLLGHGCDDVQRLATVVLAVQLARGERQLATQPSRTPDAHVVDLHAAFLSRTGIHQLGDAERALVAERGLNQWSECRALLPTVAGSDGPEESAAAG